MPAFSVQVMESVPTMVTKAALQQLSAEKLAKLPPATLRPRADLSCVVEAVTVTEAKSLAKQALLPKIRQLVPAVRVVSCSTVEEPRRVQIVIERIPAKS